MTCRALYHSIAYYPGSGTAGVGRTGVTFAHGPHPCCAHIAAPSSPRFRHRIHDYTILYCTILYYTILYYTITYLIIIRSGMNGGPKFPHLSGAWAQTNRPTRAPWPSQDAIRKLQAALSSRCCLRGRDSCQSRQFVTWDKHHRCSRGVHGEVGRRIGY